ncbi:MAG: hypothetical protein ACRDRX_02415 [Pseudonocardiaceae bacterium]
MSGGRRPAILGTGSCLPDTVRRNDDPVFDWLHRNNPAGSELFQGYEQRRVLAKGQTVVDIMVPAARRALAAAGRTIEQVDLLLGYASVSQWAMPNDLARVAARLGLPPHAEVVPVNSEFTNFNQGLVLADALLSLGRATCALIVVGGNWTRYVDYHTAPAISAGDGAAAAVLACSDDPTRFAVVASQVEHRYSYLGGMFLDSDPAWPATTPPRYLAPVFHLEPLGVRAFKDFGTAGLPALVGDVLARHGVAAGDVAFLGHQASAVLNQAWQAAIRPGQFISTLPTFANMTLASVAVNLDICYEEIVTPFVVIVTLGPEVSGNVVLLGRELPASAVM